MSKADSSQKTLSRLTGSMLKPKGSSQTKQPLPALKRPINYDRVLPNKPYQGIGSRQIISTSPFQAQTTAMHQPSISDFSTSMSRENALLSSMTPPAAHYQASFNSRPSSFVNEPEVVDLTKKSPEKILSLESNLKPLNIISKHPSLKRNNDLILSLSR